VVYLTGVPANLRSSLAAMLDRDGYPAGRLITARRSGDESSRPAGRLRFHEFPDAGPSRRWRRWLAEPAYRSIYDPDGRPLTMRLRRAY
jgi:hypothetical protein